MVLRKPSRRLLLRVVEQIRSEKIKRTVEIWKMPPDVESFFQIKCKMSVFYKMLLR